MDAARKFAVLAGFFEGHIRCLSEGVIDVVVEFLDDNTLLVDQLTKIFTVLALYSAIIQSLVW